MLACRLSRCAAGPQVAIAGDKNRTWLGRELLLSGGVQLIWGPHTVPSSGPAELWQPLLLCLHWSQGDWIRPPGKGQQVPSCAGATSSQPGGISGPGLPRHLAQSRVHLSAHLLLSSTLV